MTCFQNESISIQNMLLPKTSPFSEHTHFPKMLISTSCLIRLLVAFVMVLPGMQCTICPPIVVVSGSFTTGDGMLIYDSLSSHLAGP